FRRKHASLGPKFTAQPGNFIAHVARRRLGLGICLGHGRLVNRWGDLLPEPSRQQRDRGILDSPQLAYADAQLKSYLILAELLYIAVVEHIVVLRGPNSRVILDGLDGVE